MLSLVNRLFVRPFYAQNAGTLLVVMLLAAGFMRASDHEALIDAALGSPILLGFFMSLWGLYALKATAFVRSQLAAPDHLFFNAFRLITTPVRGLIWLWVVVDLLIPVLGYAGWMLVRAARFAQWSAFYAIATAVVVLVVASLVWVDYRLRHPSPIPLRLPLPALPIPYLLFFPTYWLRQEPASLVLTKVSSGLLLVGVCLLYPTDDYDQRLLLLGLLLAVLFHAAISRQVSEFDQRYLLLLDNLPYSVWQRLAQYLALYALIWLPELALLLRHCPDAVAVHYVLLLWLTGLGWLLLLHTLLYGQQVDPDRWLASLFGAFVMGLLTIMAHVPASVWCALGWGATIMVSRFRRLPLRVAS